MEKIKCKNCGRTLLLLKYGELEIKCPRCGRIHKIKTEQREEHRQAP